MLTLSRARQEESHYVGTRDEQQESDGAKEQPEGTAGITDGGFLERLDADGELRRFWETGGRAVPEPWQIGAGLCTATPGLRRPMTTNQLFSRA